MTEQIYFSTIRNISDKTRFVIGKFYEYKKIFKDDLSDCDIIELIYIYYNQKNNILTN